MSGFELKRGARALIRENAPKLIFIGLVYIIAITIISELQFQLPAPIAAYEQFLTLLSMGEVPSFQLFFGTIRTYGLVLSILLGLMLPVVSLGFISYCLKITRKKAGDYKDLLAGFSLFFKAILLSLMATVFILLWSLLFFFPGIAAHYRYRLVYYILLDDPKKSVIQCFRESKRLMRRRKLDLFLIDLSFLGWVILSILVMSLIIPIFPVVSIWLTPYYGLTQAAFYNQVMNEATV